MKEIPQQYPEIQETNGVVDVTKSRIGQFLAREKLFGDTAKALSDMWTEAMQLQPDQSWKKQFTEKHPTATAFALQGVANTAKIANYGPAIAHIGLAIGGLKSSDILWDASNWRLSEGKKLLSDEKLKGMALILLGTTDRLISSMGYGVSVLNGIIGLQKRHDREVSTNLEIAARILEAKYHMMNETNSNNSMDENISTSTNNTTKGGERIHIVL
jgi:hypothetical protein